KARRIAWKLVFVIRPWQKNAPIGKNILISCRQRTRIRVVIVVTKTDRALGVLRLQLYATARRKTGPNRQIVFAGAQFTHEQLRAVTAVVGRARIQDRASSIQDLSQSGADWIRARLGV